MTGRYLHGNAVDQIFAEEVGGQTRWTLTDHLGSVRDVVSDTGVTLGRITYDSFGQVTNTTGIVDTLFRYTGRPGMATTGLYDYRARAYDPRLGQFASEDPIGFAGGDWNTRRYVGNRATQYTDPSGLLGWDPLAAMGRLVGWWYGGTKGQAEQEVIAARTRAMEEAARAARQQTSIERQDRTYHGGAPSPGYHGVEPTLGGANVPHGSDSADSAIQSIGRGYGMVCLLGATTLATAVEVGGILLPGPDDALIAAAVGAKSGYRVIRGIVEGSKGSTREIAVVLTKEGKVLSRAELEALRKCGAPVAFDPFVGTGSNKGFGRLIGWGTGAQEASARTASITLQEIQAAGITRPVAEHWLNFYRNAVANGRGGAAAQERVRLMQRVIELLGG